jgi:hypothetical protein
VGHAWGGETVAAIGLGSTCRDLASTPLSQYDAGLKPLDALHLACAADAGAEYLCTCDDRFRNRAQATHVGPPKVVNPLELIAEIGP